MKRTSILLIVILAFTVSLKGYSQIRKADKFYKYYNYSEAIPHYLKVVDLEDQSEKNHAIQRLADCYRYINNVSQARIWYERAIEVNESNSMNFYYLGQSLRGLGLYQPAADAFKKFNELLPDSLDGEKYYQFCVDIQEWENLPDMAEIKNIEAVNTKYSDFGPALYKEVFVFTSDRKLDVFDDDTYGWTNFNYLNLYYAVPEHYHSFWNGVPEAEKMPRNYNQSYHDGPLCFSSDSKKVYITKTISRDEKKDADGIRTHLLKIFFADVELGKKLKYNPFPYNSDSYSVAHPTLSKNNRQIIFSSDMPGGFGGSDLYVSSLVNGKWGIPENLGEKVNTKENEVFPYWASESVLLFSSDGHLGFGGLDIFQSNLENDTWGEPENLKKPLNSSYDDFGIVLLENQEEGLFSSNRPEGKGSDDIYAFRMLKHAPGIVEIPELLVSGYVKEFNTKEPMEEATVFMFNPVSDDVTILNSDVNGYYEINLHYNNPYVVKAMKDGYIYDCTTFRTPEDKSLNEYKVPRDLLLAKLEINQVFTIENIYYDLDKWFIRKDAEEPLDNLVRIMREYAITAELSSHTDSRATHEYNNELSQKRAESAVRYIILQGINQGRMTAKGYGETRLVNECADGVSCTEAQHQKNRRTEFKITGIDATSAGQNSFNLEVFNVGDVISVKLLDANFFSNCLIEKESLQDYLMPTGEKKETDKPAEKIETINPVEKKTDKIVIVEEKEPAQEKKEIVVEKNPVPVKKEIVSGSIYRLQLIATTKTLDIPTHFSNISDMVEKYGISVQKVGKLNKYQLGNFSTKLETAEIRKFLDQNGYEGCFPVKIEN